MEFFFPVDPLDDVRRLYRQACLHRLANEGQVASRILQHDLPALVAQVRSDDREGRWTDDTLRAVFDEEYRRVLDAQAVGDFVLRGLQAAPASPASSLSAPSSTPRKEPAAPAAERPSGPQTITDMLDGMLAQERPRRSRAS